MASNGAGMDYGYKNKDSWRKTIWNEVERRTQKPEEAVVIYLAGKDNLDFPEMIKRGFHPNNLIAVESDNKVAAHLRKHGQLCINSPLDAALRCIPEHTSPTVVHCDLCHGHYGLKLLNLYDTLLWRKSFIDTVITINLLRGRDNVHGKGNRLPDNLWNLLLSRRCIIKSKYLNKVDDLSMHRSFMSILAVIALSKEPKDWMRIMLSTNPRIMSYKSASGNIIYDSIVFTNNQSIPKPKGWEHMEIPGDDAIRRQISAVLAHRTIRSKLVAL